MMRYGLVIQKHPGPASGQSGSAEAERSQNTHVAAHLFSAYLPGSPGEKQTEDAQGHRE